MFANDDFGGGIGRQGGRKNHYCCRCCHLTGGIAWSEWKHFSLIRNQVWPTWPSKQSIVIVIWWRFSKIKVKIQKNIRKIKTPGKGIYLYLNFKTHIPRGNKTVLKMYGKLIRAEIWKPFKKFLKIFWRLETFFSIFLDSINRDLFKSGQYFFIRSKLDFISNL